MDRVLVRANQQVQDADILNSSDFMEIGLGHFINLVIGTGTAFGGLVCTPTTPASMTVTVGAGSIYSLQNLESTAYGSLAADTTHQIMKQGTNLDATSLPLTAPTTSGNAIVYLIQAAFAEADTGTQTIPFRDSITGVVTQQSVTTVRRASCVVSAKPGTSAPALTAVAPAPDAGYTGLYTVTVANGATTITSANIVTLASAPFLISKLQNRLDAAKNLADVANATTALANLGGPFLKSVKTQVFSSSGTYIPSAGMLFCVVEIVGGGGGGGGSTGSGTYPSAGGGAGAGGYGRKIFSGSDIGPGIPLTIGLGGGGGAAGANGAGGGTTIFGSMTATGGNPGSVGGASVATGRGGPGGAGGTATNATTAIQGGAGTTGIVLTGSSVGGQGGASQFGGATMNASENNPGPGATGNGSGGGGGAAFGNNGYAGGNGANGYIRVIEYCAQ